MNKGIGGQAVRAGVILIALCSALGCGFTQDKKEAEQLAEQYFAKMQGEDLEGVLALYSARFFSATSREEWRGFLENQRARCGTPKKHSLVNWKVFDSFGTNAGTTTTLMYDVQYASCRVAEQITVFKPSGGAPQIQGHFFKPEPGMQDNRGNTQATLQT